MVVCLFICTTQDRVTLCYADAGKRGWGEHGCARWAKGWSPSLEKEVLAQKCSAGQGVIITLVEYVMRSLCPFGGQGKEVGILRHEGIMNPCKHPCLSYLLGWR